MYKITKGKQEPFTVGTLQEAYVILSEARFPYPFPTLHGFNSHVQQYGGFKIVTAGVTTTLEILKH